MSDLLARMKRWLQYPRLSSGEKLMQEAVQEIERLCGDIKTLNRKADHGCVGFSCKECDQ